MIDAHRRTFVDIVAAYLVAGAILGGVVAAWRFKGIPVGDFTRDPANTFDSAFYIGSITYIGAILWTVTATTCLFASLVLRSRGGSGDLQTSRFLLVSGLFTAMLLFDDLFLFHEIVFPKYLGISDYVTFSVYAAIALSYVVVFRRLILSTPFLTLILAGALLGLGMIADKLYDDALDTSAKFLIEDGLKFMGITTWFVYYVRLAVSECCAARA